jgi:hypothetical protein
MIHCNETGRIAIENHKTLFKKYLINMLTCIQKKNWSGAADNAFLARDYTLACLPSLTVSVMNESQDFQKWHMMNAFYEILASRAYTWHKINLSSKFFIRYINIALLTINNLAKMNELRQ